MPPSAKRKRGDRTYSQDSNDGSNRPSPHRPGNLSLAQQNQYGHQQGQQGLQGQHYQNNHYNQRGGRRGSRGGRGANFSTGNFSRQQTNNDGNTALLGDGRIPPERPGVDLNVSRIRGSSGVMSPPSITPSAEGLRPISPPQRPSSPPSTSSMEIQALPKSVGPYDYRILTDERIADWQKFGRASVVAVTAQLLTTKNLVEASEAFQEILRAGLDGKLPAMDAGRVVEEILKTASAEATELTNDGPSLFLDTLAILIDSDTSNPSLRPIVTSTGISPILMREQLEEPLLQALGLIRSTFGRVFIRKQTNILYRQSNYNLLREETEGYSKLITELFTTTNSGLLSPGVVEDTFENLKALIGAFDLDVGRVLDVTLDVFASTLVKQYRCFVKFLRASSWWPQDPEFIGVHSDGQILGGLPCWAQPGYPGWVASEEDKKAVADAKEQRDKQFWNRAREIGTDAFFELTGCGLAADQEILDHLDATTQTGSFRNIETRKWIEQTHTLPPPGNSVAAQLLGFKLRFYASAAREDGETLPVNLIYLAALLIKIGFISLRDLYTHLYPADEAMGGVKDKQMKEKEEREQARRPGGGALNALARAGALVDDTLPTVSRLRDTDTRSGTPSKSDPAISTAATPSVKGDEEEKEQLPEPSDQKVQLLRSLLCIGAIPEALYLLGRFPWLPDAFPDLPEYIHRILHHALSKVYQPLCPLRRQNTIREPAKLPALDQSGVPKGDLKVQDAPSSKVLRWAQIDRNDTNEGTDYRFYWDDWTDNVPVCQTVNDVFALCDTLLNFSGVKIGLDTSLLVKLARIGKHSLTDDFSETNQSRWIDLCKRLLAPALSLTKANPGVVNEMYDLFKLFPTHTRYSIYAEWFTGQVSRIPDIATAFETARLETKDLLKRISKINTRPMARALAKISCASPGVVFAVVLTQIEAYENLIDVVVECGRYFTYMGYDVLTWTLMSTLGRDRVRVSKEDGITTSGWLASLSVFSGRIFKRYSTMNSLPILQYVLAQLRKGNFTDLRVLREMIITMAGITPDTDFSDAQVQAMAGGDLLQAQTLMQVQDKRHESRVTAKRLIRTLVEHDLAVPLLVSIAQQRQMCIFNPDQDSLKIIGENFDDIHIVFTQYLEMLRSNLPSKEFDALVPDVVALISQFRVYPEVAFTIHRKSIARAIEEHDAAHPPEKQETRRRSVEKLKVTGTGEINEVTDNSSSVLAPIKSLQINGDTHMEGIEGVITVSTTEAAGSDGDGGNPQFENEDMTIALSTTKEEISPSTSIEGVAEQWHPVIKDLMDNIRPALDKNFELSMSLPFFVNFWQLSLNDLLAPATSYNDEIKRQKDRILAIKADRTDVSTAGVKKREQDQKAINTILAGLGSEMKAHIKSYGEVRHRLQKEKDQWFAAYRSKHLQAALYSAILQECFLPRLVMSPVDSFFTFKIIFYLHSTGARGFSTMHLLDRLLAKNCITNIIYQCTHREADNLGRFIYEVLKELNTWRADPEVYKKKAHGPKGELPGFAKKFKEGGSPDDHLNYEDFRRLLHKWHANLLEALKDCLQGGEYMHIKNAIMFLSRTTRSYPAVNWMGTQLFGIVEKIAMAEKGTRKDLWVAATSLMGALKGQEKQWMLPQAFYIRDIHDTILSKTQQAPSRSASMAPKSPQPDRRPPTSLNASAPEFAPTSAVINNGDSKYSRTGKLEDGELEDADMTDAQAITLIVESNDDSLQPRAEATMSKSTMSPSVAPNVELPATLATSTPLNAQAPTTESRTITQDGQLAPPVRAETATSDLSGRPMTNKNIPGGPVVSSRTPHTLPSRPDVQAAPRTGFQERQRDRFAGASSDRPDVRGWPLQEPRRHDRSTEKDQQNFTERRGASPSRFDGAEQHERPFHPPDRQRNSSRAYDQGMRQFPDQRDGGQGPRDAHLGGHGRGLERYPSEQPSRPDRLDGPFSRPQSRNGPDQAKQVSSSSTAALQTPVRDSSINPERAHLIEQSGESPAPPFPGHQLNEVSGPDARRELLLRPRSPGKGDGHANSGLPQQDIRNDNRDGVVARMPSFDNIKHAAERAPNGPRSFGPPRSGFPGNEMPRPVDNMQPPPFPRNPMDRNSQRPLQEVARPPRHQDVNYGRLNSDSGMPPSPQAQSPANGRGGRNFSGPSDSRQSNGVPHHTPLPNGREDRSQPPAPQVWQGPRTDRNPIIFGSTPASAPVNASASRPPSDALGVHPDRLNMIPGARPPPIQTGSHPRLPAPFYNASSPPSAAPSGPRSAHQQPSSASSLPSPTGRNPPLGPTPTGPSSLFDRARRDPARRFAGLHEALQQASQNERHGDRGTSIRGRASSGRDAVIHGVDSDFAAASSPSNIRPPMSSPFTPTINTEFQRRKDNFQAPLLQQHVQGAVVPAYDGRQRGNDRNRRDHESNFNDGRHANMREHSREEGRDRERERSPRRGGEFEGITFRDRNHFGGGHPDTGRRDGGLGHRDRDSERNGGRDRERREEHGLGHGQSRGVPYGSNQQGPPRLGGHAVNDVNGRERRDTASGQGSRQASEVRKRGWPGDNGEGEGHKRSRTNEP